MVTAVSINKTTPHWHQVSKYNLNCSVSVVQCGTPQCCECGRSRSSPLPITMSRLFIHLDLHQL
ncbi:hypothetical protein H5410_017968 [Solanum commersonii]|uniref:Uncharacterized protein n=1 Tax=Solanum commersonii TaxID=4109 RepID=A0A9J6A101_SOLCO|nr:hypothetical protein H5410_017968 [Solanum commersonii]